MAISSGNRYQYSREDAEDALPEHTALPPEFGLALFELEDETSGGVCYSKAEGYRRFRSAGDLSNTTLWISNLKKFSQGAHNLRSDAYLGSRLEVIAADLGVELKGFKQIDGRDKGGMVDMAEALTRTRDLVLSAYAWKDPDNDWKHQRLSESITDILLPRNMVPGDAAPEQIKKALKGAYQSYSSPGNSTSAYDAGSRNITFRRNRVQHAMDIMNTPLPAGGWQYFGPTIKNPIDFYLDPARPSLLNVTIEWRNATPELVNLIAFGSEIGKTVIRRWVSQIELMWLVQYAKIEVQAAYVPNEAKKLPASLQLPPIIGGDYVYWMSIAAGLVAESHWRGLANPKWDSKKRMVEESTASVFFKAMDRAISFQMALAAHESGASVLGYGMGGVSVRTANMPIEQLVEVADVVGASHPCLAAEAVGRERGEA